MKTKHLPGNYMIARYKSLISDLERLPSVRINRESNRDVFRIKQSDGQILRLTVNGKNSGKYGPVLEYRRQAEETIRSLTGDFREIYGEDIAEAAGRYYLSDTPMLRLGPDFWKNAQAGQNTYKNENKYILNGVRYRSRAEYNIARILTDLGLPFKYEVNISLSGKIKSADFLVYLKEFKCCFIIEFFGMLDRPDYLDESLYKLKLYYRDKFYNGRDLIVLCGDSGYMPGDDEIREAIFRALSSITSLHLIPIPALV